MRRRVGRAARVVALGIVVLWSLFPIYWALNFSFSTLSGADSAPAHYFPSPLVSTSYQAVFGINGDGADSHQRFIAKHGLTMPLLIDPGLTTAKRYDAVMGFGPLRIVKRTVVGIDRRGNVAFYERGMPSTAAILAAFRDGS